MTQEEKSLLFKDLCSRLPSGVQTLADSYKEFDGGVIGRLIGIVPYTGKKYDIQGHLFYQEGCLTPFTIEEIRPYLRPISSMTEEEFDDMFNQLYSAQEEFFRNCSNIDTIGKFIANDNVRYDWLNEHHFDYRGLIERGLAIEVTEENNPYKTELT